MPNVKSIGTKRHRTISSGADDLMNAEDSEEDKDEEDVLTALIRLACRRHARRKLHGRQGHTRRATNYSPSIGAATV